MAPPNTLRASADIAALYALGRAHWPAFEVPRSVFATYVQQRHPGRLPAELDAADLYLACACVEGLAEALRAFDELLLSQVGKFIARLRPSSAFVEEVQQTVREKLFVSGPAGVARIADYDGGGSLSSWVRVTSVRTAIDLGRRRRAAVDRAPVEAEVADPELAYLKKRYRVAFNEAFRAAIQGRPAEERVLLRRHHLEGITLDELAARLGVHRSTVARRMAAARAAVFDAARDHLQASVGVRASEVDSLLRVMRSQFDLSLSALLNCE